MPHFHLLPYGTAAQQATQDYALEASFLRIITTGLVAASVKRTKMSANSASCGRGCG